uniref:DNTTIP1_dimer domain-containing protein n=1 Tax=Trichobilharzia regenti TaxID=157069 RepID=A0AA85K2Q9_TRIRE|nr:unnamed protein product [Trichobilharzia regenti]
MNQSIKLNQSCSTSSIQDKLIINGVQTKPSYVDCNYCHLPCTTQKLKPNIGPLNPIRDTLSMINSFHVTDSQKNTSVPISCQMTSSILPSEQFLPHSGRTDFQLTSNNHLELASSTTRALPVVQSMSSSSPSSSSSNSFPLPVFNNLPPATSLANHTCPSYYSFSPHSSKPISSVKPYTTLNHTHSSSVSSRINNAKHQQMNEQQSTPNTSMITVHTTDEACAHHSVQSNPSNTNQSSQKIKFPIPYSTVFNFSPQPPTPPSQVFNVKADRDNNNNNGNINNTTNISFSQHSVSNQLPVYTTLPPASFSSLSPSSEPSSSSSFLPLPSIPPITSSSSSSAGLFSCKSSPKTTSHTPPISSVLNNSIGNTNVSSQSDNNNNSFVSNGFKDSLASSSSNSSSTCDSNAGKKCCTPSRLLLLPPPTSSDNKDLPTSNNTECSNAEEKLQSLPRFNLRYANVLQYPKYSNRRNSGFERRLKHTGLVLDAKPTLRLLRKFLQPFVNRDVDQIIKKYMDNFILLAVNNIREVLGEQSVSEADLSKFRQSLIRRAAMRYFPERSHGSPANRQGGLSNPIQQTGSNTFDAGVQNKEHNTQKSMINVTAQAKTSSSVSVSKCPNNSKLQSGIPTPDSSESLSCDNSPHLSPNPISDSGSLEKPSFITTNNVDSRTDKTLKTVQSNHRRPISRDGNGSQYSLRNNTSLGNSRKRPHLSNNHATASSESCDNPISDGNKPLVTNCPPIITDDNNNIINDLRENCPSLQLSSHSSPSSASSNSTVGFFRDVCSSDSEETLIGSNTTGSEQATTFTKLSAYEFNQSFTGVTSTVPSNVVQLRRNKPKVSSRGRKTPWWDRTRAKKSKPSIADNDDGGGDAKLSKSSKKGTDNHKEKLINGKKPLNQGDNRTHNVSLSQDVLSSGVNNNNNDSNQSNSSNNHNDVSNVTELYSNQSHTQHHSDDTLDENSNTHSRETSSRLFRKTCPEVKNNRNTSTPDATIINNNDKSKKFTLDHNTSFALGSTANSWLGMGTARGRIYSKHPELFRYVCDNEDKAWLVQTGVIVSHGVKAYLVHAEQVYHIAEQINSQITKSSIGRGAEKLKTFKLPQKILQKVRNAALNHSFFSHIISTEYDVIDDDDVGELMNNTKALKTKPHNSSSTSSSSSTVAVPPRTNYRNRSKTDIPLHTLMNQTKSTDLVSDSFQMQIIFINFSKRIFFHAFIPLDAFEQSKNYSFTE